MDWAGPPEGSLEDLFAQYDTIRSEHRHHNETEAPQQQAKATEDVPPPWQAPPEQAPPTPLQPPVPDTTTTKTEIQDKAELDRLGYHKESNWNDVRASKEENAQKIMDERLNERRTKIDQQSATIEENTHTSATLISS